MKRRINMGHLDAIQGALVMAQHNLFNDRVGEANSDIVRAMDYVRRLKARVPEGKGFSEEEPDAQAVSAAVGAR